MAPNGVITAYSQVTASSNANQTIYLDAVRFAIADRAI
jgi:hypothetical protein